MKRFNEKISFEKREKNILIRCHNEIKTLDPSSEIILYGSRARRDHEPDSDYDLLILTMGEASLTREDIFRGQIYDIELETGAVLTIMLRNRDTWSSPLYKAMPFHQNVEKEGIIL